MPNYNIVLTDTEDALLKDEVSRAQDGRTLEQHVQTIVSRAIAPRVKEFKERMAQSFTEAAGRLDAQAKTEFAAALQLPDPVQMITALQTALEKFKSRVRRP
jgi:hypothetical protein